MPAIAQAISNQVATLDHHYAVALASRAASCFSPFAVDGPALVLLGRRRTVIPQTPPRSSPSTVTCSPPPPPGLPPDRGPEFELRVDTGSHRMPRSRPMKRWWSQGELDECRKQAAAFLLDQGWIVPSRASHADSVVFARKPVYGTWRCCQDYRRLNAITQRSVEPLPHVDQLVDETLGAPSFSKLDFASAYWHFRIRPEDQFRTSFRVPGGQYGFRVGGFGLHGMSSLLMRYMHSIFGRLALTFDPSCERFLLL
jgi:hypothetical protein